MRTIEEIREITENAIEEKTEKLIEACKNFIEDIIEPNILERAKNGYTSTLIDSTSLSSLQINYIINIYEENGYKVRYTELSQNIEIRWSEEE